MARHAAGDVVWGPDAFHDDDPALTLGNSRPWLIINGPTYPGNGDQYLVCAMTSGSGTGDQFVAVPQDKWTEGMPRKRSFVDTETVFTMKSNWIENAVGTIDRDILQRARRLVKSYLC